MTYDYRKLQIIKKMEDELRIKNNLYFFSINNSSNFLNLVKLQNYIIDNEINNDLLYITILFDIFFDNYKFFINFDDNINNEYNNSNNLLCFFGVNNLLLTYFNEKLTEMFSEEKCKKIIYKIVNLSSEFIKNRNNQYEKSFKSKMITIFSEICFYNL
tara:strand:- start:19 stop:492 length:474 start_codon:yes stop_codon:yes gene_type:complete